MSMLPMDCHTHTDCSPDSDASIARMCDAARECGLKAFAVTDHIELCRFFPQGYYGTQPRNEEDFFDYASRYERSMQQNLAAKESACDGMQIICGIELGEPDADFGLADSLVQDKRLDFVIASLHELPGMLDFYFLEYEKLDVHKLLEAYFTELLKICEWGKFDVLGHLTYPLRYMIGDAGVSVELSRYTGYAAECLKAVIRNGKGIELNTSGFRQKYGMPFPHEEYLRLYRDLGGTLLTLGSDAHCPEHIGGGIIQGAELAKACGFDRVCYFLRHEPHFIEI